MYQIIRPTVFASFIHPYNPLFYNLFLSIYPLTQPPPILSTNPQIFKGLQVDEWTDERMDK